jgi:hypothetical protein
MTDYAQGQSFKVIELAHLVLQDKIDIDNATLYAAPGKDRIEQDSICQLGAYPEITESDEEIFPEFVARNGLEVLYYGQQFVDVVRNAKLQLGTPSDEDLVNALNYYADRDDFIDF